MKNQRKFRISSYLLSVLVLAGMAIAASGCNKDNMGNNGSMDVRMTDSPAEFEAMVVEVQSVEAYLEGEGWVNLSNDVGQIDVLQLTNGTEVSLTQNAELQAGGYSNVRINFGSNNYLKVNAGGLTTQASLIMQSSAVIDIDQEIKAGSSSSILLDFQVAQSVAETITGFICDPVITWVKDEKTGVKGQTESNAVALITFTHDANGAEFESYTNAQGEFFLRGLEDGIYTCEVMPRDTENYPQSISIENVVVAKGEITQMGTIQLN